MRRQSMSFPDMFSILCGGLWSVASRGITAWSLCNFFDRYCAWSLSRARPGAGPHPHAIPSIGRAEQAHEQGARVKVDHIDG